MAGQVFVRVVLGPADVTLVCEDVGYSPDVLDDMRVRAIDTLHEALHMQHCRTHTDAESDEQVEALLARMLGDDDD